jgi:hypothetical protein
MQWRDNAMMWWCNNVTTQRHDDNETDGKSDVVRRWYGMGHDDKGHRDDTTTNQRNKTTGQTNKKAGATWGDDAANGEDATQGDGGRMIFLCFLLGVAVMLVIKN